MTCTRGQSAGAGGAEDQHGSSIYGLGAAIAREAQRHMYKQVEAAWSATRGEIVHVADLRDDRGHVVDAQAGVAGANAAATRDAAMETRHDDVLGQARTRAAQEATHDRAAGFPRTQDSADAQSLGSEHPEVTDLLNLVDLDVSHPSDSPWWSTVMDNDVGGHAAQVHHRMQRRNGTGSHRPT